MKISSFEHLNAVLLLIIIGLLILFIPSFPIKIILSVVGIIYFSIKFIKKGKVGFIILFLIIVLPLISLQNYMNTEKTSNIFSDFFNNNFFFYNIGSKKILPNYEIASKKNLILDINGGLEIKFIEGNKINLSDTLEISNVDEETIRISGGKKTETYVIEIGKENISNLTIDSISLNFYSEIANNLNTLKIDAVSINIFGTFKVNTLEINGTSINLKTNQLYFDYLYVNGTSIGFDGNFQGETIEINGTSIIVKGILSSKFLNIDGTSITLNISLRQNVETDIDGTSINGTITYLDTIERKLYVDGTSGTLTVRNFEKTKISTKGIKLNLEW